MPDQIDDTEALHFHAQGRPGKLAISPTKPLETARDLSLAYSPGVAVPCLEIHRDPGTAFDYTARGNMVAVVSNGSGRSRPSAQPRGARREAGDGRQGRPVQAFRRYRRHRHRDRQRGLRRDRQHRAPDQPDLRRHQPGGHQGAGMLHHRAAAARAARHPGVPRRPARHGDHLPGGRDQRPGDHRARASGTVPHGRERRRRGRHRLPRAGQGPRFCHTTGPSSATPGASSIGAAKRA